MVLPLLSVLDTFTSEMTCLGSALKYSGEGREEAVMGE